MKVELVTSYSLPCHASVFTVNDIQALVKDFGNIYFGEWDDEIDGDDECRYGCANTQFSPSDEHKETAMQKYNITEKQFSEIQSILVKKFDIGECGWCI